MFLRRLSALALALLLTGCHPKSAREHPAIFAVIEENTRAMQSENLPAVMATIHSQNPNLDEAEKMFADLFKRFELRYTVSDLKIVSETPGEVKVSFVQKTEKVAGADPFSDNVIEGVHTLKKDGEHWKFSRTVQTKMTALTIPTN